MLTRLPKLLQLIAPWTIILILIGGFQFFRGAPVDGTVFLVIAVLLVTDAAGLVRFSMVFAPPRPHRRLVYAIGLTAAILLIATPRHGIVDGIVISVIGLCALVIIWPDPAAQPAAQSAAQSVAQSSAQSATQSSAQSSAQSSGGRDPEPVLEPAQGREPSRAAALRRAAILWSSLGILICLWELLDFLLGMPSPAADYAHPTISDLLDPFVDLPVGRLIFVLCWVFGGIALLRLGKRR